MLFGSGSGSDSGSGSGSGSSFGSGLVFSGGCSVRMVGGLVLLFMMVFEIGVEEFSEFSSEIV